MAPAVKITANTKNLVETQGTVLTFTFELSETPPPAGVTVYLKGNIAQSLTQLDLFDISYSGGDAPEGDFDFTGFYFNIKSLVATVSLPIFADGNPETPQTVVYTLQPGTGYTVNPSFSAIAVNFFDDAISGGTGNDTLNGSTANNVLIGNAGNDTLNGGTGIDTLVGGTGNDIYVVDSTTDTIFEYATEGTDTIQSSVTFSIAALGSIENLTLTGTAAINGTGNTGNNVITGNTANNTLNAGSGIDTLIGGTGNDIYVVDSTTDTITENAGGGTDTIQSSVTFSIAALGSIENLTLTGTAAINGTGNTGNNLITGNTANNTLNGGGGNDILTGGTGKDTLTGGLGVDRFDYRNLADSLFSNFDISTDFNAAAGNDLFLVSTARAGFFNAGSVATLDVAGIAAKLTVASFGANFGARFTFGIGAGTRTFVAINNNTAGFSETTDAIIEVTGLTGTLGISNFTTTLA